MTKSERIEKVIRSSIEQLNAGRAPDQQVSTDAPTFLAKPKGALDSLSIVELMVNLETGLEDEFGVVISLAEVAGTPEGRGIFLTVENLTEALQRFVEGLADD
jgi:acyl carrier protein